MFQEAAENHHIELVYNQPGILKEEMKMRAAKKKYFFPGLFLWILSPPCVERNPRCCHSAFFSQVDPLLISCIIRVKLAGSK